MVTVTARHGRIADEGTALICRRFTIACASRDCAFGVSLLKGRKILPEKCREWQGKVWRKYNCGKFSCPIPFMMVLDWVKAGVPFQILLKGVGAKIISENIPANF